VAYTLQLLVFMKRIQRVKRFRPFSCALAALLTLSVASRSQADSGAGTVVLIGLGALDATLVTHNVILGVRGESCSGTYAAVETSLAVPQVLLGILQIASEWDQTSVSHYADGSTTETTSANWSGRLRNLALTAIPTTLAVHGIWTLATKGENSAKRRAMAIGPAVLQDGQRSSGGLMVAGRF
jgi:hypothetical protein